VEGRLEHPVVPGVNKVCDEDVVALHSCKTGKKNPGGGEEKGSRSNILREPDGLKWKEEKKISYT